MGINETALVNEIKNLLKGEIKALEREQKMGLDVSQDKLWSTGSDTKPEGWIELIRIEHRKPFGLFQEAILEIKWRATPNDNIEIHPSTKARNGLIDYVYNMMLGLASRTNGIRIALID